MSRKIMFVRILHVSGWVSSWESLEMGLGWYRKWGLSFSRVDVIMSSKVIIN